MLIYPIKTIIETLAENRDTQQGHSLLISSFTPLFNLLKTVIHKVMKFHQGQLQTMSQGLKNPWGQL